MVILQEIAAALAYMHENGITHNDMKLRPQPLSMPQSQDQSLLHRAPGPRTSSCTAKAVPTSVTLGRYDTAKSDDDDGDDDGSASVGKHDWAR